MNCSYGFKSVTRKLCITALKFWKKYIIAGKGAIHNHSIEDKLGLRLINYPHNSITERNEFVSYIIFSKVNYQLLKV